MPRLPATSSSYDRKNLVPVSSLVLSRNEEGLTDLEFWDIREGNLVNPRPLTTPQLRDFLSVASRRTAKEKRTLHGTIPPGTVSINAQSMCFVIPPAEHVIHLSKGGNDVRSEKMWLPAMLFDYTGPHHSLYVFWSKGTTEQIVCGEKCLIPAPMPNMDENGHLCLGSVFRNVKFSQNIGVMQTRVLKAFFGGAFTEWRNENIGPILDHCKLMATHNNGREKRKMFWTGESECIELNEFVTQAKWRHLKS